MDQSNPDISAHPVEVDSPEWPRSPAAEPRALFFEDRQRTRIRTTRQGIWASFVVYMAYAGTDILLVPDVAAYTIAARFAFGVTTLAIFEWLFRSKARPVVLDRVCAGAVFFGYISWLLPSLMTNHALSMSYYMVFGAIFMMGANLFFAFQFRLSVITSALILVSCLLTMFLFYPESYNYQIAFGAFYLSCFVFTSYVNWTLNKERYYVFVNALEAKKQHKEATERGKALLRLSRTDPLTGLENRRAVDEKLRDHWSDWQRLGHSFAVLLVDVDFFKKYNDCYGHQEGDRCLVLVANALAEAIKRYEGSIGRYGGEEFIVLARMERRGQVAQFAEAIRRTVEGLALAHEQRRDGMSLVTVSIGAAFTRGQTGAKLEKIINEADRALYLAKASGRNCSRVFDPNDPQSSDESENIAALLKIAVAQDLVSMVYQPIQNVATGQIEAVEALMRLNMLDGTEVPPSLFIPVAERTGAILELGRWALRTVCRELLADKHVRVASVNVSPIQLKTAGFATSVAAILGETGVPGNALALEITEGLEMEMHSDILRCIADLKTLGVKIWLDDFGTGFAGLSWLRLIDFDTVKIDRSFLHDSGLPRGRSMLRDIIGLVRNRGHKILVEGVESEQQMALMREFGIDQVQGYHVGRPAPAETFRITPSALRRPMTVVRKTA
jgi:diguanylate cyclase